MKKTFSLFAVLCVAVNGYCQQVITFSKEAGITPLSSAPILVDAADFPLVNRSAELLAEDFERVTSVKKALSSGVASANTVIIIGSLTNSSIIQKLVAAKKIKTQAAHTHAGNAAWLSIRPHFTTTHFRFHRDDFLFNSLFLNFPALLTFHHSAIS